MKTKRNYIAGIENLRNSKGITLIALVITIVVIVILAGVAINLTLSENGIFNKAKYAVEQQKMAEAKEKIELAIIDIQTDKISKGEECTVDTIISELPGKISGLTLTKDGDNAKGTYNGCEFTIDSSLKTTIDGYKPSTDKEQEEIYTEFTLTADNYTQAGITREGNVVIPKTFEYEGVKYKVTAIGDNAFKDCDKLTSIEIPNSVTSIGDNAFNWCDTLTSVIMPNSVTTIGNRAFEDCKILTSIIIPNSVISIGEYAFEDCDELISVEMSNSVTSIGCGAFYDCDKLTDIELPMTLTAISNSLFELCYKLSSITIPESITEIGTYAFEQAGLTSIEIPNSVTTIGRMAFYWCDDLTSITWRGTTYTDKTTFNNALKAAGVATEDVWVDN